MHSPLTEAMLPRATKEPASITSAAHANKSAIDLPIEDCLSAEVERALIWSLAEPEDARLC